MKLHLLTDKTKQQEVGNYNFYSKLQGSVAYIGWEKDNMGLNIIQGTAKHLTKIKIGLFFEASTKSRISDSILSSALAFLAARYKAEA